MQVVVLPFCLLSFGSLRSTDAVATGSDLGPLRINIEFQNREAIA